MGFYIRESQGFWYINRRDGQRSPQVRRKESDFGRGSLLFSEGINKALRESLHKDPSVFLLGQLVNHDHSDLTKGLRKITPGQVLTFPVCENLMNSAAMGLSLAGKRPIVLHERFDFAMVGADSLINHIPIWRRRCGIKLPLVILAIRGVGKGQGPQQRKDLTDF